MDIEVDARFQCPSCENDVESNVPLGNPVWYGENPATPEMQIVTVECPFCKEEFRARAYVTPSMCSLEFIDYPLASISATPPMVRDVDDDWDEDDYDVPADPYAVFNTSLAEAEVLLDLHGGEGSSLVNRMVFAHYVGAFEAFLADTFINEVLSDDAALKDLIEKDAELRKMRFSLAEIVASSDLIKNTVRTRLRSQVWHRIKRASALYSISFGIDIRGMLGDDNATLN